MADKLPDIEDRKGKFIARNHKKASQGELRKMVPQQRSRYMAYEDPPKEVAEAQAATAKRLMELKMKRNKSYMPVSTDETVERDKHARLIGQLKAAEARNRLRIMRLRYQANRAQEITHLISCQPTALKAVRLQALVPPYPEQRDHGDRLDKLDRGRVENLLEDAQGLLTNRVH